MAQRIRGILFDLGDTLVDFGHVDAPKYFEAGGRLAYAYLEQLGQPLPPFPRFYRHQLWSIRWNYFKSWVTRREFRASDLILRISRRMGQRLTNEQVLDVAWLWYEPLSRVATAEEGLQGLLEEFCQAGMTLGVVSNTFIPGEVLDRHLEQLGLLEFLPVRVYSCDVRYRKPSRKIFRIAQERGRLLAGETLFVGDNLRADVGGANRAGMISVWKAPPGVSKASGFHPRHRISTLEELKDVVARYNGR